MRPIKIPVIIISIFLFHAGTYAGTDALNNLKAINVNIKVYDRVGRGLNKTSVKASLLKHIKAEFAGKFKKGRGVKLSTSAITMLQIKITVDGNKQRKEYNITTEAILKHGESEWHKQVTDYWDKQKNAVSIKLAEDLVKKATRVVRLRGAIVGLGRSISEIEKIDQENLKEDKATLANAEKQLAEEKRKSKLTHTIKQTLTNIASGFYSDYVRAN